MADLRVKHDPELNRMRDTYGETAEGPSPSRAGVPTQPIAARITDLAKGVTEAADLLDEARVRHRTAAEHRSKCEEMFAKASAALIRALNEHREGTPEDVPERP